MSTHELVYAIAYLLAVISVIEQRYRTKSKETFHGGEEALQKSNERIPKETFEEWQSWLQFPT